MHWLLKEASLSNPSQGSSSVSGGKRTIGSDMFVLATNDGRIN